MNPSPVMVRIRNSSRPIAGRFVRSANRTFFLRDVFLPRPASLPQRYPPADYRRDLRHRKIYRRASFFLLQKYRLAWFGLLNSSDFSSVDRGPVKTGNRNFHMCYCSHNANYISSLNLRFRMPVLGLTRKALSSNLFQHI